LESAGRPGFTSANSPDLCKRAVDGSFANGSRNRRHDVAPSPAAAAAAAATTAAAAAAATTTTTATAAAAAATTTAAAAAATLATTAATKIMSVRSASHEKWLYNGYDELTKKSMLY
jgi:hypothetical protein